MHENLPAAARTTQSSVRRRTVLSGMAAGLATVVGTAGCAPNRTAPGPGPALAHQPGVVTAPATSALFVAFDVTADGPAALGALLTALRGAIDAAPGCEVTVSLGASLFDGRFGLAADRPRLLQEMPAFAGDVLDPTRCHGDLLLQICADRAEQVAAVATDVRGAAGQSWRERWRIAGFRPENGVAGGGRPTTRNLFGFREGAGNPDPRDGALMNRLVWTDESEPAWAVGGTYQVVRLIALAPQLWDRESVAAQEAVIGRRRSDGVPLGHAREDEDFDYQGDPNGQVIPLDAHIRRANPRTADAEQYRILRRGYSYRGSGAGSDEGLIFVCFQRDPERGFATIARRLVGEALERYLLPFGGGYFFVPPAVDALAAVLPR
jgi:deferrochelatase/peroxidase EfeB